MCYINIPNVCPNCNCYCCPTCGKPYYYPTITWISGNELPVTYEWNDSTGGYVRNDKGQE